MTIQDAISRHCAELNRCNQRGGRMLSIFDLLEADTLDIDLATLLTARISRGASFLVGARPGGAGKTTVMCALLNLIPPEVEILPATPQAIRQTPSKQQCYVCHEIGAGRYFAYLWGQDLRHYCALSEKGCLLATNLHADDIEEARAQMCDENRVPTRHFETFDLVIFLRVAGRYPGTDRSVSHVYASNGHGPQNLVFRREAGQGNLFLSEQLDDEWTHRCRGLLENGLRDGIRTIEDTRRYVVSFFDANSRPEPYSARSNG